MKNKTLRVLKWRSYRWLREISILIREFFTPREVRLMMDGYKEEEGYEDYPIDLCRPKMISENTLKKILKTESTDNKKKKSTDNNKKESLDHKMKKMNKAVAFIAKQVGDMRDVGFQVGYDFYAAGDANRKVLSVDAGVFNGSNLDNQKTAWFSGPSYLYFVGFRYLFREKRLAH